MPGIADLGHAGQQQRLAEPLGEGGFELTRLGGSEALHFDAFSAPFIRVGVGMLAENFQASRPEIPVVDARQFF